MCHFKLEVRTNNAAFENRWELARMLRALAAKVAETEATEGKLRDSNGNTVGKWSWEV